MASSESFSKIREAHPREYLSDDEDEDDRNTREPIPTTVRDAVLHPFASTPKSKDFLPVPSLSDSLASLSVDDGDNSFHGDGDRSRSYIGRIESAAMLPQFCGDLVLDPSSKGKLRDRVLRGSLSRGRENLAVRAVRPLSNLRKEASDFCTKISEDENIKSSVQQNLASYDDDVIILEESVGELDINKGGEATSSRIVVPDIVTIESSSDDEKELQGNDGLSSRTPSKQAKPISQAVKIEPIVRKYSKESTPELRIRMERLNKLVACMPSLPDGGARVYRQINEINNELQTRKEYPKHLQCLTTGDGCIDIRHQEQDSVSIPGFGQPEYNLGNFFAKRPAHHIPKDKIVEDLYRAIVTQPDSKRLTNTPNGMLCTLKEHQMAGLTWMIWRESLPPRGGILADEMGLGKTISIIALIVDAKCNHEEKIIDPRGSDEDRERRSTAYQQGLTPSNATLVVAPAALIYHWENEINKQCESGLLKVSMYHGNRKCVSLRMLAANDIVITTYTLVANELKNDVQKESPLSEIHWARIVLDEAHIIKNRNTNVAKAVCRLSADSRWCVTGTPIHNNLWDLYSLIKFLKVENFSEERFWNDYVITDAKKSTVRLNLLMKNYMLRREKNFLSPLTAMPLVELPKKHCCDHILYFSEEERRAYELMYEASRSKIKEMLEKDEKQKFPVRKKKTNALSLTSKNVFITGSEQKSNPKTNFGKMSCMLVILLRLRQACVHFHLTKNAVDIEAFQSMDVGSKLTEDEKSNISSLTINPAEVEDLGVIFNMDFLSSKVNSAMNLLAHILSRKEKCVIVSQWTSFLKVLENHIMRRFPLVSCSTISGDVAPSERLERVRCFNEDGGRINVMLISITAGGVGLNLTGANHLILMDLHWNPALELQANDRIHRMGQTREVNIHKLIMKGSVEERVLALQMKKMELADNVLKGAVSKKNIHLTIADLKFLFDLESNR